MTAAVTTPPSELIERIAEIRAIYHDELFFVSLERAAHGDGDDVLLTVSVCIAERIAELTITPVWS